MNICVYIYCIYIILYYIILYYIILYIILYYIIYYIIYILYINIYIYILYKIYICYIYTCIVINYFLVISPSQPSLMLTPIPTKTHRSSWKMHPAKQRIFYFSPKSGASSPSLPSATRPCLVWWKLSACKLSSVQNTCWLIIDYRGWYYPIYWRL